MLLSEVVALHVTGESPKEFLDQLDQNLSRNLQNTLYKVTLNYLCFPLLGNCEHAVDA